MQAVRWLNGWLNRIEDGVIVTILLLMILLAVLQIVLRNFFGISFVWVEPTLQNAVLWIGLLGAMIASRRDEHIRIDIASRFLSPAAHRWLAVAVDVFTAGICGLVAWTSMGFLQEEIAYPTIAFAAVPSWLLQMIIPLGFAVMAVRYSVLTVLDLFGKRPPMEEPHA